MYEQEKLLGLLATLRPQLHEQVHHAIGGKDENDNDGGVSPAIVVAIDVERAQIVASAGVLAHLAARGGLWVDQVSSATGSGEILLKVGLASLTTGRIKHGKFLRGALNVRVPDGKSQ